MPELVQAFMAAQRRLQALQEWLCMSIQPNTLSRAESRLGQAAWGIQGCRPQQAACVLDIMQHACPQACVSASTQCASEHHSFQT